MYNKLREQQSQDFQINAITLSVRISFIKRAVDTMKPRTRPTKLTLLSGKGAIRIECTTPRKTKHPIYFYENTLRDV